MRKFIVNFGLCCVFALSAAQVASADPSAARLALQKRSAQTGFNSTRVAVLRRTPGKGNDVAAYSVLDRLGSTLGLAGTFAEESGPGRFVLKGTDWLVEASDDGNSIRARGKVSSATIPVESKPSSGAIEARARSFLANVTGDLMKLGPREELVFLGTKFGYNSGQSANATLPDPIVVSEWVAVFGRTVAGEQVIGGGSIAAVLFNGDGSVQGFDLDWPEYEITAVQATLLDVKSIKDRGAKLRSAVASQDKVTEARFECGYFDPGGRKHSVQTIIQPACMQSMIVDSRAGTRDAAVYSIPASAQPVRSAAWPELGLVCKDAAACQNAPQ